MRLVAMLLLLFPLSAWAAEPIRPVPPPPTTELTASDRAELEDGAARLAAAIQALRFTLAGRPALLARLPDVQIYWNAIRYPLTYNEQIDVGPARKALADGLKRAADLAAGDASWVNTSGPRGYVSKIDGSVQPYVLQVPPSYKPSDARKYRLDFVEHGRAEGLTELRMIQTKTDHAVGGATEKFVVLLYGRYCNANKFAGEIDLLEAFDDVKRQYPIDEDRVLNIGFSMGGASCWQFATHESDLFAAASPGAGFAETPRFLQLTPAELASTPWYQQKLWHWYDCTDYAVNLFNVPTVAYSGEIDQQKESADLMEQAMAAEGLKLERIIGPRTGHAYEKGAKAALDRRLDELVEKGRDWNAPHVRFATYTLRYNRMKWVTVDAMDREWERAELDAQIRSGTPALVITSLNVTGLTITPPTKGTLSIDGTLLPAMAGGPAHYMKTATGWKAGSPSETGLCKRHGLQGPIDDAFMDSFIIVKPTGRAANPRVGTWADHECIHAIDHWRKQFRGEARVKTDAEITAADIAGSNLILFGDPSSNRVLAEIAAKLPIRWNAADIQLGSRRYSADHNALIGVYPNPLNPGRYVVLNSGFTFREYDYLNNARQVPKLPDYAVIDVDVPVTPLAPGGVVDAGFFDERWQLPNSRAQ